MAWFLEVVANGLITGSIYALFGAGIALIYGTTKVLNFAHGELLMLGGYAVLIFSVVLGLPLLVAAAITILAVAGAGALIQRVAIAPLMKRNDWAFQVIAVTIGLSVFLQSAAQMIWGVQFRNLPYFFEGMLVIGDFRLPNQRVGILVVALVLIGLLALLNYRTQLGRIIRATSQDAEAALAVGIPTGLVHTAVFAISAALASVAAIMLAPLVSISPWMGAFYLLKGFAVVILGGLGSFGGALAAGFLLGIVESASVALLPTEWRDIVAFVFLIAVIWVRPEGLFGQADRQA